MANKLYYGDSYKTFPIGKLLREEQGPHEKMVNDRVAYCLRGDGSAEPTKTARDSFGPN